MTKTIKFFMVLLICVILMGTGNEVVNAKAEKEIKTKLVNKKINANTSEAIIEINNKKSSSVSISQIILKKKQEKQVVVKTEEKQAELKTKENWVEMKKSGKKYKIKARSKKYVDVNIKGVSAGEYKIVFYMKSGGKAFEKNVRFTIKKRENKADNSPQESQTSPVEEETTDDYAAAPAPAKPSNSVPAPPSGSTASATSISKNASSKGNSYYNAKQILLNGDFRINPKGKVEAVIFSETDYKTAYKTKIDLKIERKTKKGFKTYKRYQQIKKSNIAFLNKNFTIKKSGQYRMYVRITSYKRKNKKSIRYYKSKTVSFK